MADVKSIILVHREQLLEAQAQQAARGAAAKEQPAQPKEGEKVTLVDLAKVQAEGKQYVARAGDVIYVPAIRARRERTWIYSVLSSILTGLVVRR